MFLYDESLRSLEHPSLIFSSIILFWEFAVWRQRRICEQTILAMNVRNKTDERPISNESGGKMLIDNA